MHHAVVAADIAATTLLIHAESIPFHLGQHLGISGVMTLGHHIARSLPPADVIGRHSPRTAGQLPFSGQKLQITRSPEDRKHLTPTLDVLELLAGHLTGEEELGWVFAQALDHVLLGSVVVVAW